MGTREPEGSTQVRLRHHLERRLQAVHELRLVDVLGDTDPCLFKTLTTEQASEVVERVLAAYVAATEEAAPDESAGGHAARRATSIALMRQALYMQSMSPVWAAAVNRFTREFMDDFCFPDGRIDWEKLVRFVSEDTRSKGSKKGHS